MTDAAVDHPDIIVFPPVIPPFHARHLVRAAVAGAARIDRGYRSGVADRMGCRHFHGRLAHDDRREAYAAASRH